MDNYSSLLSYCSTVLIVTIVFLLSGRIPLEKEKIQEPEQQVVSFQDTSAIRLLDGELEEFFKGEKQLSSTLPVLLNQHRVSARISLWGDEKDLERVMYVLNVKNLADNAVINYRGTGDRILVELKADE